MINVNKGWWDSAEVKVEVSQRLKAWCQKNHGSQGTLSYDISSHGTVAFDRRDKLDIEKRAIRLMNTVPSYLKRDVQALINCILKVV